MGKSGKTSLSLLILLAVLVGCGTKAINSHWRGNDIKIDEKDRGWFDLGSVLEDPRASLAILNDNDYLYLGLRTTNADFQRLVLRGGVTWWFDREGGDKKTFGIRFPVGLLPMARVEGESDDTEEPPRDFSRRNPQLPSEDIDLFTSGDNNPRRMTKMEASGIEARYRQNQDTLYYLLKIPLRSSESHPFAIETTSGAEVGIGAETATSRPPEASKRESSEGGRGAEGGLGRRRGGGRGREGTPMNRSGSTSRPDPLKVWLKVDLAAKQ